MAAADATIARCAACSTEIPSGAKFCPRCGEPAPTSAPANLGKLPAPLPVAGILFLVALVLGPAAVVAGIMTGHAVLLYGGIALAVGVVIVLLLGLVF